MSSDDGLFMWQRIALAKGEPIDVPPQQRRAQNTGRQLQDTAGQPPTSEHPAGYRIDLPWTRPPLNMNQRLNPWAEAKLKAEVRHTVKLLAKQAKIPHHDRITVQLHYAPGRRGRRDPANLVATSKPAIDGLVDAKIVDDDDSTHVLEITPQIHFPPEPGPRCWLIITTGVPDA